MVQKFFSSNSLNAKRYLNRVRFTAGAALAGFMIIGMASPALAQVQHKLHNGRITKSFTEPIEKSISASAEAGIVVVAFVKEGDRVTIGQPLAAMNQTVLKASLAIAEETSRSTARLDVAKSQLELTKSQLDAINSLVNDGHTSRYEVEQKTAEYQQAFAELRAAEDEGKLAKLEVKRIQAQLADRTIKSPINGFVTEIHKQPGENLSNNEPQYATVVRVDELKVRFYLDAETLQATSVGDLITVLIGRERKSARAKVSFVSPIIDADSGLGRLDVVIPNGDLRIQSGISCFWDDGIEPPAAFISQRPHTPARQYTR